MPRIYSVKRHAVIQPLDQSYRIIALTRGQNTMVDAADYDWLNQWPWCAVWNKHTHSFYAKRSKWDKIKKCSYTIAMANEILQCSPGEQADHISHDTLDNRKENLRKTTNTQNCSNKGIRSTNKSGYIGVCWYKKYEKWNAYINHINLGYFDSAEEAARARDEVAKKLHGEFAVLNFPGEKYE